MSKNEKGPDEDGKVHDDVVKLVSQEGSVCIYTNGSRNVGRPDGVERSADEKSTDKEGEKSANCNCGKPIA